MDTSVPLYKNKLERNIVFFLVSFGVITLTYGFLYAIDFLPEKPTESDTASVGAPDEEPAPAEPTLPDDPEVLAPGDRLPISIYFDTLEKKVSIVNPEYRTIAALDQALLSGVVRHPDSADFEDVGTIFLFGHSSYLPTVINKNFQAFNGIQNLAWGDTVRLQSRSHEYVYRVDRVYQVKATNADVDIERGEAKLLLVTCNTFGSKDDRYIVEASLIDSYKL